MSSQPVKNNLIMILDILRRHTDKNHRITQLQLQKYLQTEFEMKADRKTVKRNLMNLVEFGFDIGFKEIERGGDDGNVIITDIYYNHTFDDSELKIISDGLLFSKYISAAETKKLITKIESQSSPFTNNKLKNSLNYETSGHTENSQILNTVELINQAIENKKQIAFHYCEYGTDKKLHPKKQEKYVINPYYTVTANGRYYLICNVDKYDNIANFRIDKIIDTEILSSRQKAINTVAGLNKRFSISEYMKEHIYMFGGNTVNAKLEIDSSIIGQVIDWFGKEFNIRSKTEDKCIITLEVNENALFYWAMQYGQFVKVIRPQAVADRILNTVKNITRKYGEE
ncbi:MAG: helix-turn-helix transcriptional regulator [Oscillospiraceae bacterium]